MDKKADRDDEHQDLKGKMRHYEHNIEGLQAQLAKTQVGTSNLHGEVRDLRKGKVVLEREKTEMQTIHEKLLQEHSLILSELKIGREELAMTRK